MQVIAQSTALVPELRHLPDWEEMFRGYAERLSVPASAIRPREEVAARIREEKEGLEAQNAAQTGAVLTGAAKNLSDTDVGGGQNAFQALLGGG